MRLGYCDHRERDVLDGRCCGFGAVNDTSPEAVQRFYLDHHHSQTYAEMKPQDDGDWVRHEDYAAQAAAIKTLVEALEWQSEVIDNAITENEIGGHRLFLDDEYHMGPVVDWVHTILTGFSKINRAALAAARKTT